jgi:hypothetical protein
MQPVLEVHSIKRASEVCKSQSSSVFSLAGRGIKTDSQLVGPLQGWLVLLREARNAWSHDEATTWLQYTLIDVHMFCSTCGGLAYEAFRWSVLPRFDSLYLHCAFAIARSQPRLL